MRLCRAHAGLIPGFARGTRLPGWAEQVHFQSCSHKATHLVAAGNESCCLGPRKRPYMCRSALVASLLVLLSECSSASRGSAVDSGVDPGAMSSLAPNVGSESDSTSATSSLLDEDSSSESPADDAAPAAQPDASPSAAPDFSTCPPSPPVGDFPLDVASVLMGVCQHCHRNPPVNHAPFELLNYEDILQLMGGIPRWQDMYKVIQPGSVPHMPPPTVPPLTAAQLRTLSDWLASCALPVPEGTGGDVDRDATAPSAQTDATTND
jgi:hypothetical protein